MLLIARLLLSLVFGVAGVAKLIDSTGSRASMGDFGVPAFLARPLAWLLPLVELACAAALMSVSGAWWGASGALAMLLVFMAAIAINLVRAAKDKKSIKLRRKRAAWTEDYLASILGAKPH